MRNYQHHVLPHLRGRPDPKGAWRQHLSKYENNFYLEVDRIHDGEIREGSAEMIREWKRQAQKILFQNWLIASKMMHSHA